jgi:hypothetical protein
MWCPRGSSLYSALERTGPLPKGCRHAKVQVQSRNLRLTATYAFGKLQDEMNASSPEQGGGEPGRPRPDAVPPSLLELLMVQRTQNESGVRYITPNSSFLMLRGACPGPMIKIRHSIGSSKHSWVPRCS